MAKAWPRAIGTSAAKTAVLERFCSPRATENSQPIPGLRPCQAPSRIKTNQGHIAESIIGGLAGVQELQEFKSQESGVQESGASSDRKFLIAWKRVNHQFATEKRPPATPELLL